MRTGTWISASIEALPINSSAKIILAEIENLHKSNSCRAGNKHFAKILGISTESVSRIISKLRELGYVTQKSFDGRIRTLEPTYNELEIKPKEYKSASHKKNNQTFQKAQSRDDADIKPVFAQKTSPLVHKEQTKKILNNMSIFKNDKKLNPNNWKTFVDWAVTKFSGSTRELLLSLDSPNANLPPTIRIAWEAWS
ncbi:helix-turn-helix domain-containing protein [Leptospira sp. GIMC2001]|uniref:helix-turn-helix domain-containing protein n=1 Tax=Leptospira sp. GIMC2001 TaxID=1513297 RepID=UPI00234A3F2C|nr:helix-turn-helix domain-containing protein [Leptospira sp. GIMC2001]WCL50740.1 helix-turn-helix domain-containing protein [Leptospira sp. GIMC2001]